ncbi:S8 family peptidase [Dawidia soli]|uniref:S8 family serine peptidase n=1 Tax=Dawidia soli TaxID=2782352 RepID=A0AAP2DB26_9BACT|nr:S8 family serine peptidase [Dawidia soli]MBT1688726.1 S8 family serine peptidase [Dawidia soli]
MKLLVKDYLNVRVGAPNVNAPSYQYLAPGSEIEVDGRLYDGGEFENIATWYRDAANNYYWSGGFANTKPIIPREFDPAKMSWGHERYNLPFIWSKLKTMGEGITVAVIDTGIDILHQDLATKLHRLSKSFVSDAKDIKDIDGHGTNMAGIIGASGRNKVFGVAPGVELLILRASEHQRGANVKLFAKALDHAAGIDAVDIISVSTTLPDDPDLKTAVDKCHANGKTVVAAIGNNRDINLPMGPDVDTFPACYEKVLAVGAFDLSGHLVSYSNWNRQLDFLAPGASVLTAALNDGRNQENGTSMATAFTAGCLALMFAYAKGKTTRDKCIEAILSTCDDIGPTLGPDIRTGRGLLNLRNAITKL